jgi:protein farnesyltransferase/geranylgeranyltransferase type-1 subunit alpha
VRPSPSRGEQVVAIQHSQHDREVLQYFLAVAASGEKSLRALALTEAVILINSASYPAWAYRWQCLEALYDDEAMRGEHAFLERIAAINVKNYQLWNHRRQLAFCLGPESAHQELEFAGHCLEDDPKNYHTWAHRLAVVDHFGLWQEELVFTALMIEEDVRNNSAWNQRCHVLSRPGGDTSQAALEKELEFVADAIRKAPHNQSPWNYLRGITKLGGGQISLPHCPQIHNLCQEILEELPSCSPALALLADVYAAQMHSSLRKGEVDAGRAIYELGGQCFRGLLIADPIRRHYWKFRLDALEAAVAAL